MKWILIFFAFRFNTVRFCKSFPTHMGTIIWWVRLCQLTNMTFAWVMCASLNFKYFILIESFIIFKTGTRISLHSKKCHFFKFAWGKVFGSGWFIETFSFQNFGCKTDQGNSEGGIFLWWPSGAFRLQYLLKRLFLVPCIQRLLPYATARACFCKKYFFQNGSFLFFLSDCSTFI